MSEKKQPKHKGEPKYKHIPKFARKNPGKGKHGVDDKGANKVAKQWEKRRKEK